MVFGSPALLIGGIIAIVVGFIMVKDPINTADISYRFHLRFSLFSKKTRERLQEIAGYILIILGIIAIILYFSGIKI